MDYLQYYNVQYLGRNTQKNIIYFTYNDKLWSLRNEWSSKIWGLIIQGLREYFKSDTWELQGIPETKQSYINHIVHNKITDTVTNPYDRRIHPRMEPRTT